MKQLLKIRNLLSFILLLALLSACKGKQENSESAQPAIATDCSAFQTQIEQLKGQVASAKEEGRNEVIKEQEEQKKLAAGLSIEKMGLPAISFEMMDLSSIMYYRDGETPGFFSALPDFFDNDAMLRGIYSNPGTLRTHYTRSRFLVKNAINFLGMTATVQNAVTELAHYTRPQPEDAIFRAGWIEHGKDGNLDWNTETYWTGKGLAAELHGMPVYRAALRWKWMQRRVAEAQDFHSQGGAMLPAWHFILTDFAKIIAQTPAKLPAPAGEGG